MRSALPSYQSQDTEEKRKKTEDQYPLQALMQNPQQNTNKANSVAY